MRTKAGEKRIIDLSADIIEFRGHSCLFATPLGTTESRKLEPIIEELSTPVVQAQEGLLVVPLIGRVDGSRAAQLRNQLLNAVHTRSEEHTSELQSRGHLVCRLLLEKK